MALEVRKLTSGYRNKIVISDVSFMLQPGEIMAFFGHNGAGKSTTLKTILGAAPSRSAAKSGSTANGSTRCRSPSASREACGMLPDRRGVFPDLTVAENLEVVARDRTARRQMSKFTIPRRARTAPGAARAPQGARRQHERRPAADARVRAGHPRLAEMHPARGAVGRPAAGPGRDTCSAISLRSAASTRSAPSWSSTRSRRR